MEKLSFLAAKKEQPKCFFYIIDGILNLFLGALYSVFGCLFIIFYGAGGGGAGSVPAPVRSLLEPFFIYFYKKQRFTYMGAHFPARIELPCK